MASMLIKRETLELVRAYYKIRHGRVRKHIFEMVKAMGGASHAEEMGGRKQGRPSRSTSWKGDWLRVIWFLVLRGLVVAFPASAQLDDDTAIRSSAKPRFRCDAADCGSYLVEVD